MSKIRPPAAPMGASIVIDGTRVEHAVLPPHDAGFTSTSEALSIGISFTGHRDAITQVAGRPPDRRTFAPATVGVTGRCPVTWLRTAEPSESIEVFPSDELVASTTTEAERRWRTTDGFAQFTADPWTWAAFVRLRRAAVGAESLDRLAADALLRHLILRIGAGRFGGPPLPRAGRLDAAQVRRVVDVLHTRLADPPTLAELAAEAFLSPFHFQRSFKRTTGLTPHQYLVAVRMEASRRLLSNGSRTVREVASATGYADVRHFRRQYRAHFGVAPRATSHEGPSPGVGGRR